MGAIVSKADYFELILLKFKKITYNRNSKIIHSFCFFGAVFPPIEESPVAEFSESICSTMIKRQDLSAAHPAIIYMYIVALISKIISYKYTLYNAYESVKYFLNRQYDCKRRKISASSNGILKYELRNELS